MRMPSLAALRRRRQSGALPLLIIILVLVIFLIVIGTITYILVHAIKKIVPPPPSPDPYNPVPLPVVGSQYMGGTVQGYTYGYQDVTSSTFTVWIVADDEPHTDSVSNWFAGQWTNSTVVYSNQFTGANLGDALNNMYLAFNTTNGQYETNGVPLEQFTNCAPPQRFYEMIVSNCPAGQTAQ